jgi:PAS domain S-box-containing protein
LKSSEELYRGLVEEISDWICDVDEHFICTYSSPRVKNILGYDPGEVIDRSAFDFMSPEEVDRLKKLIGPHQHPRIGFDLIQCRLLQKDGRTICIEISGKPIFDRQGRFKCNRGLIRDITERKQAENSLRRKQSILAKSQKAAHLGNWAWNVLTDQLSGSEENWRILGLPAGGIRITMHTFLGHVHPEDRARVASDVESLRVTGQDRSIDYRIVRPDSSIVYVNTTTDRIVLAENGNIMWVYGITQDITERKRVEKALADEKARAEFYLDLMGHDIINLNQVARGYLELLDGMVQGKELKQLIARPLEAIDGSSRLIENVRKLQKSMSGNFQSVVYDLGALIEEVAAQFKAIPDRDVRITCGAIKDIHVQANELLRDVFTNLIDNAIKHSTGPASITIRMASDVRTDGQGYCTVTIDDNGPGIPDQLKEMVFKRMQRGDTKAKGSGLGLFLVKSLVEDYGGKVWAEDRVKGDHTRGARFKVLLPTL